MELLVPERYRASHPDLRAGFFQHPSTRSMGSGRDLYGLCKDGSEVPIEIGLNPVNSAEGAFVLASIIDISERKRSEEICAKARNDFRPLFENLTEGLVLADLDGQLLHWNKNGLTMFGFSNMEEALLETSSVSRYSRVIDPRWHDTKNWRIGRSPALSTANIWLVMNFACDGSIRTGSEYSATVALSSASQTASRWPSSHLPILRSPSGPKKTCAAARSNWPASSARRWMRLLPSMTSSASFFSMPQPKNVSLSRRGCHRTTARSIHA